MKLVPLQKNLRLSKLVEQNFQEIQKRKKQKTTNSTDVPKNIEDFARLITIRSGNKLVPFELYEHQKLLLSLIENNRGVIGVKSRQMGATQAILLYFLHKASLNPAYSALVFSKGQDDTSKAARRCREMIKSLEGVISLDSDNLETLSIANGGTIYFRNSKIDGARGIDSVSDILYDEAAFVPLIELLYSATAPTQSMVGSEAKTIVLSTPNGQAGWYFDRCNENNPDDHDFLPTIDKIRTGELPSLYSWVDADGWAKYVAHWKCHPLYSQTENYLESIANKNKIPMAQVRQEYDLSFVDSAERVFSAIVVKQCCIGEWSKVKQQSCLYYLGIDTSLEGNDYFVCVVLEVDPMTRLIKLVDWYRKRGNTMDVDLINVSDLIDKYEPEGIAIETNAAGIVYQRELEKLYPQLTIQGMITSNQSKNARFARLLLTMEKLKLILPNERIIKEELLSIERQGKQIQAIAGKHDDFAMALTLGVELISSEQNSVIDFGKIKTVTRDKKPWQDS